MLARIMLFVSVFFTLTFSAYGNDWVFGAQCYQNKGEVVEYWLWGVDVNKDTKEVNILITYSPKDEKLVGVASIKKVTGVTETKKYDFSKTDEFSMNERNSYIAGFKEIEKKYCPQGNVKGELEKSDLKLSKFLATDLANF